MAAPSLAQNTLPAATVASIDRAVNDLPATTGAPTVYGLGVSVAMIAGRRRISHAGEVSGFTARNDVYPEERAAAVSSTPCSTATSID